MMRLKAPNTQTHFRLWEFRWERIALQAAGADAGSKRGGEAPFANLQEAAYDYAGLQRWPLLGKTLFAPGAWTLIFAANDWQVFRERKFHRKIGSSQGVPLLLICDGAMWCCPCGIPKEYCAQRSDRSNFGGCPSNATGALGQAPQEFRRRVINFFEKANESSGSGPQALRKPAEATHSFTHAHRRAAMVSTA